jgi:Concanavalin A-like lectin/glucanases superfamily
MATQLFLRDLGSSALGLFRDLSITRGVTSKTAIVATAASGTNIQWTKNTPAGLTQSMEWISGRSPVGGWTLSGVVTANLRALCSSMNANIGGRVRLYKRTAAGSETELTGSPWDDGVEFGTADAAMNWTFTPTSMAFAEDDRLIVRFFITAAGGTMASGFTGTMSYDGPTAAAAGDTYVTLNETVAFKANDAFNATLLHLNGADASTTITDSGDFADNWTVTGNAQIDTAQSVFGGASLLLDGTGDQIQATSPGTILRNPAFNYGRGNPFTIDFRVRIDTLQACILYQMAVGSATTGFYISVSGTGEIKVESNATIITGGILNADQWYHIAVTQDSSNNMRLFIDGTQSGSTFDASAKDWTIEHSATVLPLIGFALIGWIDEYRIRVGEAVWTANFTPPTAAYGEPQAHVGEVDFDGSGILQAFARSNQRFAATLGGSGSLSVDAAKPGQAHVGAATFNGAGNLSVDTQKSKLAQTTFNGAGTLSTIALTRKFVEADFDGIGALSVAAGQGMQGAATFAGAGSLSGDATHIAAGGEVHQGAATFVGTGSLSADENLRQVAAATFVGEGNLATDAIKSAGQAAATFVGVSSLSVRVAQINRAAAAFAGAGSLSALAAAYKFGEATLAGTGNLSVTAVQRMVAAATFAGSSTLSADALKSKLAAATLEGVGSLSTNVTARFVVAATFNGQGNLSALVRANQRIAATFTGAGDFSAFATITGAVNAWSGEARFEGAGNLSAVTRQAHAAVITLQGAGSLTAAAQQRMSAAATLAGSGSLSVATQKSKLAAATFPGAGLLSADVTARFVAAATLNGVGSLSALVAIRQPTAATFSGTGSLSVEATITGAVNAWSGEARFAGAGNLSAATLHRLAVAATLGGAGNLSIATQATTRSAEARFAGAGNLSIATQITTRFIEARFAGVGNVSANAAQVSGAISSATFIGVGSLSINLRQANSVRATFAGTGSVSINTISRQQAAARFAGSSELAADTTQKTPHFAEARFAGESGLSASLGKPQFVEAILGGEGSMSVLLGFPGGEVIIEVPVEIDGIRRRTGAPAVGRCATGSATRRGSGSPAIKRAA